MNVMTKTMKKRVRAVPDRAGNLKGAGDSWQFQTAKARFPEVFERARTRGPQRITRQGQEGVVMISDEQFQQLIGNAQNPKSLVQFFRESPFVGVNLHLEREKDTGRDIDL
jgi:antitoxin Phd